MSRPLTTFLKKFEKTNDFQSFERKYFSYNVSRFINRAQTFKENNPKAKSILLFFGALFVADSLYEKYQFNKTLDEISFRKKQLQQPIRELTHDESYNFLWNEENLNEWLYRPVKISGRPIHSKAKLVPRIKYGHRGYDYIVPLVTDEQEDGSQRKGILLNMGWMPRQWKQIGSRLKIEDASLQTFIAYVSLNSELEHTWGSTGNAPVLARNKWNTVDIELMAENSEFVNVKEAKVALLERVNLDTPLDEHIMEHYDHDATYTQDYPYKKTQAGALQLATMPWVHNRNKFFYESLALVSLLGGFTLALI